MIQKCNPVPFLGGPIHGKTVTKEEAFISPDYLYHEVEPKPMVLKKFPEDIESVPKSEPIIRHVYQLIEIYRDASGAREFYYHYRGLIE